MRSTRSSQSTNFKWSCSRTVLKRKIISNMNHSTLSWRHRWPHPWKFRGTSQWHWLNKRWRSIMNQSMELKLWLGSKQEKCHILKSQTSIGHAGKFKMQSRFRSEMQSYKLKKKDGETSNSTKRYKRITSHRYKNRSWPVAFSIKAFKKKFQSRRSKSTIYTQILSLKICSWQLRERKLWWNTNP